MSLIEWKSKFISDDPTVNEGITRMLIKGILVDSSANKNNWKVEPEDFQKLAADFVNIQLRMNHGEKVSDVLGRVLSTEVDQGHVEAKNDWDISNELPHIHFCAEIATKDNDIIVPLKLGFVDFVSPAIDATEILCSTCRKKMVDKNIKTCGCKDSGVLLKNMMAREVSMVVSPAYEKTAIKVYSFAAAVDREFLSEDNILTIVEDELSKRGL